MRAKSSGLPRSGVAHLKPAACRHKDDQISTLGVDRIGRYLQGVLKRFRVKGEDT